MKIYLSIDIGGTTTRYAFINDALEILEINKFQTDQNEPEKTLDKIIHALVQSKYEVEAIGLSCPGPADNVNGIILDPPNLVGWHHFNIKDYLESNTKTSVYMENDANLAALAEAHQSTGSLVQFITMSTGIGAGLVKDGVLFTGAHNRAFELANIIMKPEGFQLNDLASGSIESISSGTGIVARAKQAGIRVTHAGQVYALAQQGNKECKRIFEEAIELFSNLIAMFYAVVDPDEIVVGGGIILKNPELLDEITSRVKEKVYPTMKQYVNIKISHYGDDSGLYGGALYAMNRQIERGYTF